MSPTPVTSRTAINRANSRHFTGTTHRFRQAAFVAQRPAPRLNGRQCRTETQLVQEPADHGFVFSKDQVEAFSDRLKRLNQSRHIEYVLFHMQPPSRAASASF